EKNGVSWRAFSCSLGRLARPSATAFCAAWSIGHGGRTGSAATAIPAGRRRRKDERFLDCRPVTGHPRRQRVEALGDGLAQFCLQSSMLLSLIEQRPLNGDRLLGHPRSHFHGDEAPQPHTERIEQIINRLGVFHWNSFSDQRRDLPKLPEPTSHK